jgi:outer membrane lipoprotein-sorting protein
VTERAGQAAAGALELRLLAALALALAAVTHVYAEPAAGPDAAASDPVVPEAADLSSLLAGMRSATGVVANFTETKEIKLLSAPLESTGTIYFLPPGRLARVITSPGRSRLIVDGDKVRFEDETGSKAMELAGSVIARQLIDSFVVLFNGDEKRLRELYHATFSTAGGTWRLRLVPRSMPLSRMIGSFDLTGRGARIERMEATEPDGDRTITLFGDTEVHHRFSEAELAELFGTRPGS